MLTRRRVTQTAEENANVGSGLPTVPPPPKWSSGDPKDNHEKYTTSNGVKNKLLSSAVAPHVTVSSNSSQDRTHEFMSVIKSTQIRQNYGIVTSASQHHNNRSDFAVIAKKIGKDLASTFAKLEKLTILAVKKSHHNVDMQETEQLTTVVQQDLSGLNKQIAHLQQYLKAVRTPISRHNQMHANAVVVALQSRLVAFSTEFKAVVEHFNATKREEAVRLSNSHPSKQSSYHDFQRDKPTDYTGSQVVITMDDGSQGRQLHQRQQQVARQQFDQRADTMTSVEQTIVELGGIFQQFAHMVKEQEEMVYRIDSHIDEANLNIDAAHTEITKYFHTISSNRSLMIKIFVILVVFFVIFAFIIR